MSSFLYARPISTLTVAGGSSQVVVWIIPREVYQSYISLPPETYSSLDGIAVTAVVFSNKFSRVEISSSFKL